MGKSITTKADIVAIQYAIERYFGRQIINYKDCTALCNDIYKRFEIKMSEQTIRRFFGLIKSQNETSITTLNILARYIEYNGWEDFIQSEHLPLNALSAEQETFIREFYNIIILPSEIIYPPQDVSYYQISYILATRIVRHDFSVSLIQMLARNPASQLFFYEMFPYYDGLAGKYAEGINEYIKENK